MGFTFNAQGRKATRRHTSRNPATKAHREKNPDERAVRLILRNCLMTDSGF